MQNHWSGLLHFLICLHMLMSSLKHLVFCWGRTAHHYRSLASVSKLKDHSKENWIHNWSVLCLHRPAGKVRPRKWYLLLKCAWPEHLSYETGQVCCAVWSGQQLADRLGAATQFSKCLINFHQSLNKMEWNECQIQKSYMWIMNLTVSISGSILGGC